MAHSSNIIDIFLDKAFYTPGEPIQLSLQVHGLVEHTTVVQARVVISHLANVVDTIEEMVTLTGDEQTIILSYTPPLEAPRGYGIDLCLMTETGSLLACGSTAFDVLQNWIQAPRYGFITDFFPERPDVTQTIDYLSRYHINGLQFYDWMYRHHQFLTDQEPYLDPLGRRLSLTTVENLITAAHNRNIAAMPYTAIYAASVPFYEEHPDWALYKSNGQPFSFGENFLVYMDPRPDSPWVSHLLEQFDQVMQQTEFDGIHLDQYGDPKQGYDYQGQKFNLASPLAATINATKELVLSHRPHGAVVFNAVANWPIEAVAQANQDFIYIEVWSPYTWFDDLHGLITQAQELSEGKPVVLAAYLDPSWEHNVLLVDAIIFACGGSHIELGEHGGMLADAYFPRYKTMSQSLEENIRHYYDFTVRYEDVIGPATQDATQSYLNRIAIEGVSTSPSQRTNKVFPIVRQTEGFTAISLINLVGIHSPEWAIPVKQKPEILGPLTVRIYVEQTPARAWMATPDKIDPSAQALNFVTGTDESGNYLLFEVPMLEYWSLVVLEWEEN